MNVQTRPKVFCNSHHFLDSPRDHPVWSASGIALDFSKKFFLVYHESLPTILGKNLEPLQLLLLCIDVNGWSTSTGVHFGGARHCKSETQNNEDLLVDVGEELGGMPSTNVFSFNNYFFNYLMEKQFKQKCTCSGVKHA